MGKTRYSMCLCLVVGGSVLAQIQNYEDTPSGPLVFAFGESEGVCVWQAMTPDGGVATSPWLFRKSAKHYPADLMPAHDLLSLGGAEWVSVSDYNSGSGYCMEYVVGSGGLEGPDASIRQALLVYEVSFEPAIHEERGALKAVGSAIGIVRPRINALKGRLFTVASSSSSLLGNEYWLWVGNPETISAHAISGTGIGPGCDARVAVTESECIVFCRKIKTHDNVQEADAQLIGYRSTDLNSWESLPVPCDEAYRCLDLYCDEGALWLAGCQVGPTGLGTVDLWRIETASVGLGGWTCIMKNEPYSGRASELSIRPANDHVSRPRVLIQLDNALVER